MLEPLPKHIKLSDKAIGKLKEALYQEIGISTKEFKSEELHRLGSFVLKVVTLSSKIKLKKLNDRKITSKS
tara:strand:- start:141574 stop:141786 length:213 start_codon:yes stop_codon:yes gene_type:complete